MTVKEAIEQLQKLPDQNIAMVIDCPYCGRAHQLGRISQMVVLENTVKSGQQ